MIGSFSTASYNSRASRRTPGSGGNNRSGCRSSTGAVMPAIVVGRDGAGNPLPSLAAGWLPVPAYWPIVLPLGTYWPEFLRSFGFALIATVLALLIGYPIAYLVA